jgi:two-component system cell cycle response regulator
MARSTETVVTKISQQGEAAAAQADGGLVVFYGQNIGRRYFLNLPELIIGRSDAAAIQVDQESVSRQHAKLTTFDYKSWIEDMGSTNGTFVNNVRVERTELRDGDLLGIGQTIFKYLSGSNIENKYHEEIYKLSTIDGLTETYNKRYFLNTLERELNRAYRYDRGLSLALFDIDHFKKINDSYGHLAGDQVLRELAALVNQNIRRQDILARYGGEEFAIILPEIDTPGSVMVCEKLRVLTDAHPFKFGKDSIHVTISCGIIAYTAPLGAIGNEAFIAEADAKLYAAKSGGRNQVRA